MDKLLVYKLLAFALIIGLFFWEKRSPATPEEKLPQVSLSPLKRYQSNALLWLINSLMSPLITVPVTVWFAAHSLDWRGLSSHLLVDLLLLDIWIYWWHRANHQVAFLWRFHQIHHLDQRLDVTTSVRFHFGEVFLSAVIRGLFIWLLGISWQAVLIFEALTLLFSAFHHSNIRLPGALESNLSRLIITPSIHWVHHHVVRRDTDSNYGVLLSLWDHLFGSFSQTPRSEITALGLDGAQDQQVNKLLWLPFSRKTSTLDSQGR